ncbi:glycine-rich protein-like [Dorcoceras hygrometricum]|uniref:Glycine-rich protein-like n=1 Tax=Dorcoceras hygrometricum TaxID=472368 RepID=A0A2Z7AHV0_9LAMI|nr:glycine-rich protein-like [Dorcoceras hygrometricum]
MGSKGLLFLVILIATDVLVSSEVAVRELADASNSKDTANNEAYKMNKLYQHGGYLGGRRRYLAMATRGRFPGGCQWGCCGWKYDGCACCGWVDASGHSKP